MIAAAFATASCQAADVVPLPEGFGLSPRHETVATTYSTREAAMRRTLSRSTIEKQCAAARGAGLTQATPTFASAQEDDTTESSTFVSEQARAVYETLHGYACTSMSHAPFAMCDCHYHADTIHRIHLHLADGTGTRVVDIDIERGTATERRLTAPYSAAIVAPAGAAAAGIAAQLEGPVTGHGTVAGLPCTLHRKDVGPSRTELCLADSTESVPAPLRGGELSRTVSVESAAGYQVTQQEATRLVQLQARVDVAVFELPDGVHVEQRRHQP